MNTKIVKQVKHGHLFSELGEPESGPQLTKNGLGLVWARFAHMQL